MDEDVWGSAFSKCEGAQVFHGKECLVKGFPGQEVGAVNFELFGLRGVEPGERFKC